MVPLLRLRWQAGVRMRHRRSYCMSVMPVARLNTLASRTSGFSSGRRSKTEGLPLGDCPEGCFSWA
jgi:hypothetical protein